MSKASKFDNRFFCICPKCENRIYEHLGLMEYPEGKYTINVKCVLCHTEFQHIIWSNKARNRMQMEEIGRNMGIKNITELGRSFIEGATKKKKDDEDGR